MGTERTHTNHKARTLQVHGEGSGERDDSLISTHYKENEEGLDG